MRRGDFYRVRRPKDDPRPSRVYLVVSRRTLIESTFPTVVCAPVHTERHGLSTQVDVGAEEGLKHESALYCDALVSVPKRLLTDFIGSLSAPKLRTVDEALRLALELEGT